MVASRRSSGRLLPPRPPPLLLLPFAGASGEAPPPAETFRFTHWPHEDACWRAGARPPECCHLPSEASEAAGCWDDFWTRDHCCGDEVVHRPVADDACVSAEPLERPTAQAGGSTFNRWLLESAAREGALNATHISDFWWPNVIGAPYFLKLFGEERRRRLAIVSGSLDWRAVEGLCLPEEAQSQAAERGPPAPKRRAVRCFVLLRDPVDRFVSYWAERSNRRLEEGGRRTLADVPPGELAAYLATVRADSIRMEGTETGVGCNREVGLCLARDGPAAAEGASGEEQPTETPSFRILRGPQNRLARMLDPAGGSRPRFAVAARRLERCTVGAIDAAHREDLRVVLAHRAPWIREVHMSEASGLHIADVTQVLGDEPVRSYVHGAKPEGMRLEVPSGVRDAKRNHWYGSESRWLRSNLSSDSRAVIEDFNDVDTPLYHLGMQIFKRQAAEARLHFVREAAQAQAAQPSQPARPLGASLNVTVLHNHSWAHHFDGLGLHMTRFMTDGLKCLLTGRAMQCARFLRMRWPDYQDAVMDPEDVAAMIREVFPWGGARYLVD